MENASLATLSNRRQTLNDFLQQYGQSVSVDELEEYLKHWQVETEKQMMDFLDLEEVRELDTKRLKIQYHEGIYAGGDTLHLQPAKIQPEPLLKPQHPAEALDERSREVVEGRGTLL